MTRPLVHSFSPILYMALLQPDRRRSRWNSDV